MRYTLRFLKFFLKRNLAMLLLVGGGLTLFFIAYNTPSVIKENIIVGGIQTENEYVYVYEAIENDEVVYKTIIKSDLDNRTVEGNKLYSPKLSNNAIIFWILFTVTSIALIIATFSDAWRFESCRYDAMNTLVYCEFEDDVYYFFIKDRLIYKDKSTFRPDYNIAEYAGIYKLSQLNKFPKFQTKMQKRDNILNNIGVS